MGSRNSLFTVVIRSVLIGLLTCSYSSAACLGAVTGYMGQEGGELGAFPSHLNQATEFTMQNDWRSKWSLNKVSVSPVLATFHILYVFYTGINVIKMQTYIRKAAIKNPYFEQRRQETRTETLKARHHVALDDEIPLLFQKQKWSNQFTSFFLKTTKKVTLFCHFRGFRVVLCCFPDIFAVTVQHCFG